MLKGRVEALDR